jgi:hypothetical protein
VLLRVYAKCIDGQAEAARLRIESALNPPEDVTPGHDKSIMLETLPRICRSE